MNWLSHRTSVVAFLLLGAGLSSALSAETPKCPDKEPHYTLDSTRPLDLDQFKQRLFYYKCFHYDADIETVIEQAMAYITDRAPQASNSVLVLDIDETALSNWPQIQHNDYGYIAEGPCDISSKWACGARSWYLSQRAEAIKPTLKLFKAAQQQNVKILFISGREDDPELRTATEGNLRRVGYDNWLGLIMRPLSSTGPVAGYKTAAREAIEAAGFNIIANVGDQKSDLDGGYSERTFKLPNPFYRLR